MLSMKLLINDYTLFWLMAIATPHLLANTLDARRASKNAVFAAR
jgi:hypothetical protein